MISESQAQTFSFQNCVTECDASVIGKKSEKSVKKRLAGSDVILMMNLVREGTVHCGDGWNLPFSAP